MKYKKKIEEDINRDRYLITYADLITLLLGLFVILYSSSQVDEKKYEEVKKAFSKVFSQSGKGVLNGSEGILNNKTNSPISQVDLDLKSLEKLYSEANVTLNNYIENGSLNVRYNGSELVLSLNEDLLFKSGSNKIEKKGFLVLDTISTILKRYDKFITVDGHTDNDKLKGSKINSNWELSVLRALSVVNYLIEKNLTEQNLAIRGFGENRPLYENSNEINKKKNRRVEISISEIPITLPSQQGYEKKN